MRVIYCYTNKLNNKKYIGQTINPEQRRNAHKSNAFNFKHNEYNSVFHKAVRKYGWDNFQYEELATVKDFDTLNFLEEHYIKTFNTIVPNGYNILSGGQNCSRPKNEEYRKKISLGEGKLTEEEVILIRKAYQEKQSPKKYYDEHYNGQMHYNSFLNIWTGQKYKQIMPEVIETGRHTKLNWDLVNLIREEYLKEKTSYDKLAKKYNVSRCTIRDVIKYRTWKEKE